MFTLFRSPSRQVADLPSPGALYSDLMDLIVRFARAGLIHGDFNEFNILIRRESGEPIVIDFPQMVSTSHKNAEWYVSSHLFLCALPPPRRPSGCSLRRGTEGGGVIAHAVA